MKLTLPQCVERLCHFAMLLLMVLCFVGTANAIESDDINAKILSPESTVIPKWDANDWIFNNDSTCMVNPTYDSTLTDTISMSFSSQYAVDFKISEAFKRVNTKHTFKIRIDGEEIDISANTTFKIFHKYLPEGQHRIDFIVNFPASGSWVNLKSLALIEYKPLETSCVKEGSLPLTFENDSDFPWLTYDGYIQSMNYDESNSTSRISTTFTIDQPSLFSYEYKNGSDNTGNTSYVYIDDFQYKYTRSTSWVRGTVVLYPGTYTITLENTHTSSNSNYYTQFRNICLSQEWIDVTLNQPGELAVRILQALGDKNLQDAEMVKIRGSLNDEDWSTIKQLTGIRAVDFTYTDISSIPESAFSKKSYLSTVMMPKTLATIGKEAFIGTNFYEVTIPKSVETIGAKVFFETPLRYIHFEENSNLKKIGYAVFDSTNLTELIMPNSVTSYGTFYSDGYSGNSNSNHWDLVKDCNKLRKLHLSDGLAIVPDNTAYGCSKLKEVHLPVNATVIERSAFYGTSSLKSIEIPESMTSIEYESFYKSGLESLKLPKNVSSLGQYAFRDCTSLKDLILNSHCNQMDYTFYNCTALQTILLPCATPPSIVNNPFYNVTRSNIKLTVPDFALQSYRTDSYWYNFTNSIAGDEASISDYWALRGNLALDSNHLMQGTPSVEIMPGGVLTMDADMSQAFNDFTFRTNETTPASYLSKTNNVDANSLKTKFYVSEANKWFFFSPVCDVKMSDVSYPSTDSWVIRYYDGERRASQNANSGNWTNVPSDGTLHRGQGYIIQANKTGWLTMPIEKEKHADFFGENEVTFNLAENPSEAEANAGWNFVSNPYPCYYDIYYIDMQAPITVWTGKTYRAYSLNDGDRGDDTFVLRPMQPFFVQKSSSDLTTGMPLTGRRTSTVIDRSRAPKPDSQKINILRNVLNLELVREGEEDAEDYTRIVINEQSSVDYERNCDATKFMSMDESVAQLFSLGADNYPMAINERPYEEGNVALGVYMPKSGETYSISATRSDRKAWIYDAETGIEQDLTEGDYTFMVNKTGYDYNRFSIRFSPVTNTVEKTENVKVKVNAGIGYISVVASGDANVTVYGIDGRMVASCMGPNVFNVPAGVYVIRVDGKTFKNIVK